MNTDRLDCVYEINKKSTKSISKLEPILEDEEIIPKDSPPIIQKKLKRLSGSINLLNK